MIVATEKEGYEGISANWVTDKIKAGWQWLTGLFSAGEDLYARCGELKMGDRDSNKGGTKGNCVKILQDYLWRLGYYQGLDPALPYIKEVDGIFGPRTRKAVERFQKEHGLPMTGIVDKATWQVLTGSVGTKPEVVVYQPYPVYVPTPTYTPPTKTPPAKVPPTKVPPAKAEVSPFEIFEKYLPFIMMGMAGVILYVALTRK